MLFAGWEVSTIYREKLLPRSQVFTLRTYPKLANNIYFFPAVNWLANWFLYATLSLNRRTCRLQTIRKNSNERVTQILDKERCIKDDFQPALRTLESLYAFFLF